MNTSIVKVTENYHEILSVTFHIPKVVYCLLEAGFTPEVSIAAHLTVVTVVYTIYRHSRRTGM
jgi:hypothetical protein